MRKSQSQGKNGSISMNRAQIELNQPPRSSAASTTPSPVTASLEMEVDAPSEIPPPALQKQKPKKRSKVWHEFLIIAKEDSEDGKERALCAHCKQSSFLANSHYGTSNLKKHLDKCEAYHNSVRKEGNVFDQKVYRELVSREIIKHGYAFSWVEHEGNREIHTYLNNQVRTICRNTAKADCLQMHKKLKSQLENTLHNIPGRICLTADMWTSIVTEGYLCLTAHFVDANWKLNSKVLNFCHIETPHTGKVMYNAVLNLLQEWGIVNKVFSITLDNASSNDKMQDSLKTTLNDRGVLLYKGAFFHVRCAAHVLNLIVQDGLQVIAPSVFKVRESVKYVKWSEARKNAFRKCVQNAGILGTKALWLDVPTRWNSTYMMLDRALFYRKAFKELQDIDSLYKHFPEPEEWDKIEKIRDVLEPFCDISELFSGSDYPTANLYFENVWKIAMLLEDLIKSTDDDIRVMAIEMKKKLKKYWNWDASDDDPDDYTTLFAFAVILDPRYKLNFLKYCYRRILGDEIEALSKACDVKLKLENLLKEYTPKTASAISGISSETSCSGTSGSCKRKYDYLAEYDEENSTSMYRILERSKLDAYLEDAIMDRKTKVDILEFWKENEHRYGELSHLARDILSVPLTTVASESTFSIGGRILNKWRSCYLPENVEALITSRSWLFGYEPTEEDDFTGMSVDWSTNKSPSGHPN